LQAECGHKFVIVGTRYLGFFQVAGIALNIDFCTWFSEDGQLGGIGEHEDEGNGIFEVDAVLELAFCHTDGIELMVTMHAEDIEFTLIKPRKLSLNLEAVFITATRQTE
jgi:hypothetical protein